MNVKQVLKGGVFVVLVLVLTTAFVSADTAGTRTLSSGFTYQGQLKSSAEPYTGSCDFQFKLYDDQVGGAQVGTTQNKTGVLLNEGYFTVVLDFGPTAFDGEARWLEIDVRCPAGSGSYTTLAPRQALTAAPYAWFAQQAGSVPWDGVVGVPPEVFQDTQYSAGTGLSLTGTTFSADTSVLQQRVSSTCPVGSSIRVINANGTVTCQPLWGLAGNAGTDPATHYLGTSDNVALELRVNGLRALRLEPHTNSPNLVGGHSSNSVADGVHGAVISGGGSVFSPNIITQNFGVIGGGIKNTANHEHATVGGGLYNTASGWRSTVSGGSWNTASGTESNIGGGYDNTASGIRSTVGGGDHNEASGGSSTVPGGRDNTAAGHFSLAAGRRAKANAQGCFVWGDSTNVDVVCDKENQWVARASGGVIFYSDSTMDNGVELKAGGGSWGSASDKNLKENFEPVDQTAVLEALMELPISTWNYITQDESIRHIGPMAQDFHAAFGVGENDTTISTVNADGVALAAIQGLYAENQELKSENARQQQQLDYLETRLAALEAGQTSNTSAASLPLSWLMGLGLAAVAGVWVIRRPHGGV